MYTYLITAVFTDDTHGTYSVQASSPKKAIEEFKNNSFNDILRIESIGKECDIDIEQPEFHMPNEFTIDDVDSNIEDYTGQLVLRTLTHMRYIRDKKYRTAKYQLVRAVSGFGCDPTKIGTAIFVVDADKEDYRLERYSIMGVAKPEAIEKWQKLYGKITF